MFPGPAHLSAAAEFVKFVRHNSSLDKSQKCSPVAARGVVKVKQCVARYKQHSLSQVGASGNHLPKIKKNENVPLHDGKLSVTRDHHTQRCNYELVQFFISADLILIAFGILGFPAAKFVHCFLCSRHSFLTCRLRIASKHRRPESGTARCSRLSHDLPIVARQGIGPMPFATARCRFRQAS